MDGNAKGLKLGCKLVKLWKKILHSKRLGSHYTPHDQPQPANLSNGHSLSRGLPFHQSRGLKGFSVWVNVELKPLAIAWIFWLELNGISAAIYLGGHLALWRGLKKRKLNIFPKTFPRARWLFMLGTSKKSRRGLWSPSCISTIHSFSICWKKPSPSMASATRASSRFLARFLILSISAGLLRGKGQWTALLIVLRLTSNRFFFT